MHDSTPWQRFYLTLAAYERAHARFAKELRPMRFEMHNRLDAMDSEDEAYAEASANCVKSLWRTYQSVVRAPQGDQSTERVQSALERLIEHLEGPEAQERAA